MNKALFIDRDGVILQLFPDVKFIYKKDHAVIIPGVVQALHEIKNKNYLIFVLSNQSAIADGITTVEEVEAFHEFLNAQLEGAIDAFYFCPHHPKPRTDVPEYAQKYRVACTCRKPAPGLIFRAAEDFNIDIPASWLIGDLVSDIAAGFVAGCKTVLVPSAHSGKVITTSEPFDTAIQPTCHAKDLADAVKFF